MLGFRGRPTLSVVVAVFDMVDQAANTIASLAPGHQHADPDAYEIVVVENRSDRMLDPARVQRLAPNARHLVRDEPGESPAGALNHGVRASRGDLVALMVDGARMVTPGVVGNLLAARRLADVPVVSVPGYHLGDKLHQEAVHEGYGAEQEQQWLRDLCWPDDGYRLFDRAVLSASCAGGFLKPIGESNCVALPRRRFDELGGFDVRFTTRGGGFVNLDFYRRAVLSPGATLVVLPGEGTFHQFHGGATTGAPGVDREALLDRMRAEYEGLRGEVHAPPAVEPVLLGRVDPHALPFLAHSVRQAQGLVAA